MDAADIAELTASELLMELIGPPTMAEDTAGGTVGIGGTKYCGWNPLPGAGIVGGGGCVGATKADEECIVAVCGETDMGGCIPDDEEPPAVDVAATLGGGGVGLVAKLDGCEVTADVGGGIDNEEELQRKIAN